MLYVPKYSPTHKHTHTKITITSGTFTNSHTAQWWNFTVFCPVDTLSLTRKKTGKSHLCALHNSQTHCIKLYRSISTTALIQNWVQVYYEVALLLLHILELNSEMF